LQKEKQSITPTKPGRPHGGSATEDLRAVTEISRNTPKKKTGSPTQSADSPTAENEDLKSRYREYKQRQNMSALGNVFKWSTEQEASGLAGPTGASVPAGTARSNQRTTEKEEDGTASTAEPPKTIRPFTGQGETALRKEKEIAAKTSAVVTMPSHKKYEESKDQIAKLQNHLQSLLSEKQQLEKDYSKFGPRAEKSMAQRKKKEEIEFELDLNEKNIQRVKHKLRELNAFS